MKKKRYSEISVGERRKRNLMGYTEKARRKRNTRVLA